MNPDFLKNRKIGIVGYGVNNQKLAEYFKKHEIEFSTVEWLSLKDLEGKLDRFDIIFRTPGLPFFSKAVTTAQDEGVSVSSQTKLFFDLCPCPVIGVTGTKGKGTTASLIFEILKAAGKKAWLAGNIGKDPFEFLDEIDNSDLVVLELSSFQLQDLDRSPHIAVVLAITPDHLNHHKDFNEYIQAKSPILKHQSKTDFAVLHSSLPDWFKDLGQAKKIFINPKEVAEYQRKLLGIHNLDNIAAALAVARLLKVSEDKIKATIAGFKPLPHRLKILRDVSGVTYVDDAFSTNIEPTMSALDSFNQPIILIVGGFDKGLDFAALGKKIKKGKKVKAVIVVGSVKGKILKALEGFKGTILTGANNMRQIITQANSIADQGDVILFSPATSSFDMFKNEFDRGEQFEKIVANL